MLNMSLHNVHIEKLSKENYETWKLQMKAILIQNDFWEYVNGSKQPPENANELWRIIKVTKRLSRV